MNGDTVLMREIHVMDSEFRRLTGREAFLYVSEPGDGARKCVFVHTQVRGVLAAHNLMTALLATARSDPKRLPYPFDQALTAEQDRRGDEAWVRERL